MRNYQKYIALILFIVLSIIGCKMTIWEDKTSDAYWTTSGQPYDSGWCDVLEDAYDFTLTAIVGWNTAYRPNKIRISFSGVGPVMVALSDSAFQTLTPFPHVYLNSGEYLDITYIVNDLKYLDFFDADNDFKITKIEFGFVASALNNSWSSNWGDSWGDSWGFQVSTAFQFFRDIFYYKTKVNHVFHSIFGREWKK